jgi:NitT/TauT family transport system substrate-binding protein
MTAEWSNSRNSALSRRDMLRTAATTGLAVVAYGMGRTVHGQRKPTERMVTLSHSVNTTVYAPHLVAQELGFFKDAGINATFVVPGGGARVAQVIAGDQAKFALGDSSHPITISEKGRPCMMIYATDTRCSYANIAVRKELWDKGLNTVEKLATMKRDDGSPRVIAATAIGSGTWVYGNVVLSQFHANGKSVNDQIKWVGGGETSIMLGGLKSGQFDAIMAVPEWMDAAQQQGFGVPLFDISSTQAWMRVFKGNVPTTVGYVLKTTIESEPELVQDYVTAIWRAMQWLKGRKPEEIYDKIGMKYMSTFDREVVLKGIRYYQAIFNYDLLISRKDFENTKRVMNPWVSKKDYSYESLVDMRFAEKARKA